MLKLSAALPSVGLEVLPVVVSVIGLSFEVDDVLADLLDVDEPSGTDVELADGDCGVVPGVAVVWEERGWLVDALEGGTVAVDAPSVGLGVVGSGDRVEGELTTGSLGFGSAVEGGAVVSEDAVDWEPVVVGPGSTIVESDVVVGSTMVVDPVETLRVSVPVVIDTFCRLANSTKLVAMAAFA